MDYRKISLYAAIIVVVLLLWNAWQREYGNKPNPAPTQTSQTASIVPSSASSSSSASSVPTVPQHNRSGQTQSQSPVSKVVAKTSTL